MANNRIILKRTSTTGRTPNTTSSYAANSQYIGAGELAINMTDGILYSSNGSTVIEVGANNTNASITNTLTVAGVTTANSIGVTTTGVVTATGTVSGFELTSTSASGDEGGQINLAKPPNATTSGAVTIDAYQNKIRIFETGGTSRGAYIDLTACAGGVGTNLLTGGGGGTGTVTQVNSGNGLTGGPITGSGTLSVLANNGIVSNSTGTFAVSGLGTVVNSTGINVNANNGITATAAGVFVNGNNGLTVNSTGVHVLANTGIIANTTGTFVNATYINSISSNSATYLGNIGNFGNSLGIYTSGVVNASAIQVGTNFVANTTRLALSTSVGLQVNGTIGTAGQVLTSNGTTPYWATASGGGSVYMKGGTATIGSLATEGANIFRVNANTLNNDTTIADGENAQATGPLAIAAGKTLTIQSGARVSIV